MKYLRPRRVLIAIWIVLGVIAIGVSFCLQDSVYRDGLNLLGVALLVVHVTQLFAAGIWLMAVWFEDKWWPF